MSDKLQLEKELDRIRNKLFYGFEYDQEYLNYTEKDQDKNWKAYEKFTIAFTSLEIDWNCQESVSSSDVSSESLSLVSSLLRWLHLNTVNLRYFPPNLFRCSEVVHGLVSLLAEKLKINNLLLFSHRKLIDLSQLAPLFPLRNEMYFLNPSNRSQASDLMVYYLVQQTHIEGQFMHLCKQQILNKEHVFYDYFSKLDTHYQAQLEFLSHCFFKLRELKPELEENFDLESIPKLHYLEKFPEFVNLCKVANEIKSDFVQTLNKEWLAYVSARNLPRTKNESFHFPTDFLMDKQDQIVMARSMKDQQTEYFQELQKKVSEYGIKNDALIRQAFSELNQKRSMDDEYDTSVYQYYLAEAGKIKWDLQDVYKAMAPLGNLDLSDNDMELCDIVKEIAYCEGFAYTIGHQNLYHAGYMHPFTMWITQQCHEEMKHYHAVRVLLQQAGVCTQKLDEDFMAQVFEEPNPDAYHDQYNVFNLNFLGEVHNIRAYLLLADAFENKDIQRVLRWVTEDEVVHKKVFHFHFKYLSKKYKDWEKNAYECMIDTGFGTHQASHCSRYKVMMEKIGRYYDHSTKYSALQFLNMSMRAQYLELKSLYSPEIFKISEFDFRRRHLKAFVH